MNVITCVGLLAYKKFIANHPNIDIISVFPYGGEIVITYRGKL